MLERFKSDKIWLMRSATYVATAASLLMIVLKGYAWHYTNSLSLLSSLVDSALDAAMSLVNMYAVFRATQPPTQNYRFGQGKVEALAAAGQSIFITASSCFLLYEIYERVKHPVPLQDTAVGLWVMGACLLITLVIVLYQRYVTEKTHSLAIRADNIHYETDFATNLAVIVSLVANSFWGVALIDTLFALAIALYILVTAFKLIREAFQVLMDHELSPEDRAKICDIILSHPEVQGYHDLRTRSSGLYVFIQVHLELDPQMPLVRSHTIAELIMARIHASFPNAEVIVHQDPHGVELPHDTTLPKI